MSLESTHPSFDRSIPDQAKVRDAYEGERAVKNKGETYLPSTSGMRLDGMEKEQDGYKDYQAYKLRAVFPDYVSDGISSMIGTMHQKPPRIELPSQMEYLLKDADGNGTTLSAFLRELNEEQLVTGRVGILLDLPEGETAEPIFRLLQYVAETIRNWGEDFTILDESGLERDEEYKWTPVEKYRLLKLIDEGYAFGVSNGSDVIPDSELTVAKVRSQPLKEIPFVFINSKDLVQETDTPPLLGLANDSFTIYRGEADYRQNLFMQGQDTLVIKGQLLTAASTPSLKNQEATRTGAGSKLHIDEKGDAKYIGVSSTGLSEQRQAIDSDRSRGETKSGALISRQSRDSESGESLKTRIAAQTVTLNQIALTGAEGLQQILRTAAEWLGLDPEEVIIIPNVDFVNNKLTGDELVKLQTAKAMGAKISQKSLHDLMKESKLTGMEFEDELELISGETNDL